MKLTDRILQNWRIAKARPFIPSGARILDVGSADGVLFQRIKDARDGSMGIDPTLAASTQVGRIQLVAGCFPQDLPDVEPFDVITMLATLEHFPPAQYEILKQGCARFLRPGGKLIITVPSAAVDRILHVLKWLRLIDGMSLEEHHGYEVSRTPAIFSEEFFVLRRHATFQLGLNNLFVFERRQNGKIYVAS
jgi:2-polyprenyl-3-methyl-5-hydroxy-6-metoxy-1,4-benzoquinol methylase